ncbi:MAG: hypothetical protein AAFR52_06240, partial [Pseudomonadota bacterium]
MTEERTTPLRARMIEDMRIRGLGEKAQKTHIRMSSIIRARSGVVLSSVTGTSCLTMGKTPILRPEDPLSEERRSDERDHASPR